MASELLLQWLGGIEEKKDVSNASGLDRKADA